MSGYELVLQQPTIFSVCIYIHKENGSRKKV